MPNLLTPHDYRNAAMSQGACNASGLIHSLHDVIDRVLEEARARGQGTDYANTHPIVKMYTYQLFYLAWGANPGTGDAWMRAFLTCAASPIARGAKEE